MRWPALVLLVLALASPALAKEPEPLWQRCFEAIDWHVNTAVPNTERYLFDWVKRGSLVAYSKEWVRKAIEEAGGLDSAFERARKERKPILWYVPHIEGQHVILPHLLDRYMMVGPLSHPDVTRVVNERFVPVKLPAGGELGKKYELVAPDAIEPALLILSPEGTVIDRIDRVSVFDPTFVRRFLVTQLRQRVGEWSDEVAPAIVERSVRRGDDDDARSALRSIREPVARARLATELARCRGDASSDLVTQVEPLLKRKDAAALRLAWATLLVREGQAGDALPLLEMDGGAADPERGYHLAVAQYLLRRELDARSTWAAVAKQHPESIWGAKADAYARDGADKAHGEGPLTRGMLYLHGPAPDDVQDDWRARCRHRGVDFLLQSQRSDGSWEGARWGSPNGEKKDEKKGLIGYHNIKTAISALCCRALSVTPVAGRAKEIEAALARGEKFLLRDGLVERFAGIVWTYADAFRLYHFSKRFHSLPASQRKRVRRKIETWIRHLMQHQEENKGCFQHAGYRSTFVTACVTYCLWHVRDAGFMVPGTVFHQALYVIERARGGPRGLYGYLLDQPSATRSIRGAAGRHPLCEWVFYLRGRRTGEQLAKALDIFEEGYVHLEKARKGNFHIPKLDYTAGYYFFHDFYPACEVARAGGEHTQHHVDRLLRKLRALQEPDGTFLDCGFSYGKCYSTAMALMSLEALTRQN